MKSISTATRIRRMLVLLVLALTAGLVPAAAQKDFRPYRDPSGRFTLQCPRDWQVLYGAGATLLTLVEKKGRVFIQVEYLKLNQPLKASEDHDLIVQIESDLIRERQLKAEQVKAWPRREEMPLSVVLDFARPGLLGPERVRQFSVVRDVDLFRILCVAPAAEFPRFEPAFTQVAQSFTIAGASSR